MAEKSKKGKKKSSEAGLVTTTWSDPPQSYGIYTGYAASCTALQLPTLSRKKELMAVSMKICELIEKEKVSDDELCFVDGICHKVMGK